MSANEGRPVKPPNEHTMSGASVARCADRVVSRHSMPVASCLRAHGQVLIDRLADDIGRLRRRVEADLYTVELFERIAFTVDLLDSLLQPTAAAIYRQSVRNGVEDEPALQRALEDVGRRQRVLRRLLGEKVAA
jgi:hypothetical protein